MCMQFKTFDFSLMFKASFLDKFYYEKIKIKIPIWTLSAWGAKTSALNFTRGQLTVRWILNAL
jgi:hypothetical protein